MMNGPLAWGHAAVSFVHATPSVEEGFFFFFWPFLALLTVQLEECDRERRSDLQQRDPGRESNPGPLQSLGTRYQLS